MSLNTHMTTIKTANKKVRNLPVFLFFLPKNYDRLVKGITRTIERSIQPITPPKEKVKTFPQDGKTKKMSYMRTRRKRHPP